MLILRVGPTVFGCLNWKTIVPTLPLSKQSPKLSNFEGGSKLLQKVSYRKLTYLMKICKFVKTMPKRCNYSSKKGWLVAYEWTQRISFHFILTFLSMVIHSVNTLFYREPCKQNLIITKIYNPIYNNLSLKKERKTRWVIVWFYNFFERSWMMRALWQHYLDHSRP